MDVVLRGVQVSHGDDYQICRQDRDLVCGVHLTNCSPEINNLYDVWIECTHWRVSSLESGKAAVPFFFRMCRLCALILFILYFSLPLIVSMTPSHHNCKPQG